MVIVGAGGHGRVIADIAKHNGYNSIMFLDDNKAGQKVGTYTVVGDCDSMLNYNCDIIVAIGNGNIRRILQEKLLSNNKSVPTLIHPSAIIAEDCTIGCGTVVMAGAVINTGSCVGRGCIVNTCAAIDHDCNVGDYSHISVGSNLAGTVNVGGNTWVGIGAVISNNINVVDDCIIGAGAAVVKDITTSGTYIGVPAKRINKN